MQEFTIIMLCSIMHGTYNKYIQAYFQLKSLKADFQNKMPL